MAKFDLFLLVSFVFFFISVFYLYNHMLFCKWRFPDAEGRMVLIADPQMEGDDHHQHEHGIYDHLRLYFNDAYLSTIFTQIKRYLKPGYVVTLGDLFSSQWIDDEEFMHRSERFKEIYFLESRDNIKIINVTGNHDIGFGQDVSTERVERFEKVFGTTNFDFEYENHLFGVVNSMVLDGTRGKALQRPAWAHMQNLESMSKQRESNPTVVLTHIPLHKDSGACPDSPVPELDAYGNPAPRVYLKHGSSDYILDRIKPRFVFSGHNLLGCHFQHRPEVIEITLTSVMGEYNGFVGMFEWRKTTQDETTAKRVAYTKSMKKRMDHTLTKKRLFTFEDFEYSFTPCPYVSQSTIAMIIVSFALVVLAGILRMSGMLPAVLVGEGNKTRKRE